MATNSSIEWTDASWNPTVGCRKVSPGCLNCYAETMSHRLAMMAKADKDAGRDPGGKAPYMQVVKWKDGIALPQWNANVVPLPDALDLPLSWRKPRRVFVNSMSDLFHEDVSSDFIDQVFAVMALAPEVTFQILTKRPERMREYLTQDMPRAHIELAATRRFGRIEVPIAPWPLPNVWLGVSVEDQERADERIPLLLDTPAAVRFLSCEPQLGDLNLRALNLSVAKHAIKSEVWHYLDALTGDRTFYVHGEKRETDGPGIDWVIMGGESGPKARPFDIGWARSIRDQCQAAGVAFFMKQLGKRPEAVRRGQDGPPPAGYERLIDAGGGTGIYRLRLRDSHGGDWDEWPADLRIREFPG